ncbi:MAG: DUF1638 domain-containing protein [Armatimonadota bacterium]
MKLYAIACEMLSRECYRASADSPHTVFLDMQKFDLHIEPDKLRNTVQQAIDDVPSGKYDYIVLAYGLCSRGTAGLVARDTPIVIPRAHDCITLLLGSKERYQKEFNEHPGTYYYSAGWVERNEGEVRQGSIEIVKDRQEQERYLMYVEKYGEENAQYLIDQEKLWLENYNRAVFIDNKIGDIEYYRAFTHKFADTHEWNYEEIAGDTRLIDMLLRGEWNDNEFLIIKPGQKTVDEINNRILAVE